MASLDDFPIGNVLQFVRMVVDRCWDKTGTLYQETVAVLTLEEARMIWAASKWIEVLIFAEVKSKGGNDFTLEELQWMLFEKTVGMKAQDPDWKALGLDQREMKMMMDIEAHLDRYASRAIAPTAKKWSNSKKGKKN